MDARISMPVAIPRLNKPKGQDGRSLRNQYRPPRVRKACDNCHNRKVKCTGEQPHCQKCVEQHVPCMYSRSRKDRLSVATEENRRLIAFLKDLRGRVEDGEQQNINVFLASLCAEGSRPTRS
ncbi:hypothetical protein B0J11DRAFT_545622 [Dendryphion nanum]|uniref:Zn(2)-C6 fungal-type domain-containing protein n=1 Tax=Dendryphion nanum TaxID=256645 RepID=A0A9P9CXN0_9PLEO|nr:hypothetical protein B0J11DRAFT_545622 [Dendryphion nanum]